jgi:hypothetical protein
MLIVPNVNILIVLLSTQNLQKIFMFHYHDSITWFWLSLWLLIDVNFVLGLLHHVAVGNVV